MVEPLMMSGTTIIASGSNGVPGTWTERGWRCASLARMASPWSITQPLIPEPSGLSWARIRSANRSREMTARRTPADRSTW